MTDPRSDPPEPEASLKEIVETGIRRAVTAVIAGAAIVGLAIYARPAPPRYEAFAVGSQIVRVDTRTGTIISCEGSRTCVQVLRRGQRVTRVKRTDAPAQPQALPKPAAATPPPAAPAAEK